ncbi:Similar to Centromere protein I; acc. no. Q8AYS7 [Pyronema omphalodes CBS 100304]|uniref:Similar to Centromere protein I acc. no. Q8AYS7 n=1 Tax=Pyronema omphalodes (strain CBS 100304) TaxID=1076935 RepID=U4KXU6_PYROM|nr:Similar to Centromere protein I; acc. no. Q8AYS7 [Pyronema omphalodes CBS 100304]
MPSVLGGDIAAPVYEDDAVGFAELLQQAAETRNAVSKSKVSEAIDGLTQFATIRGLRPEILQSLVDTLTKTPCYLDQSQCGRIIKALIPRRKVSEEIVVRVVGCLGNGVHRPGAGVQAGLLRWLVMVYNVLEDYEMLSRLYGVLFNLLDMMTLRGYVCHLLSLITRRKHIKPFRIQALLQLQRDVGSEQPINALIQIYKNYYPDVIMFNAGPFKSTIFSHPDPDWMQKLLSIQEASASLNPLNETRPNFKIVRKVGSQSSKRRKTERVVVPEVHTFGAIESTVTLEEVQNADDFVQKLDKLELPNQLAAVLEDPLLQQLVALKPTELAQERIENWLAASLYDTMKTLSSTAPGAAARTSKLLEQIAGYTKATRTLLPPVQEFLKAYLQQWDGQANLQAILMLCSFLPMLDFDQLHTQFLSPIDTALSSNPDVLITFYTSLLRHWTFIPPSHLPNTSTSPSLLIQHTTSHLLRSPPNPHTTLLFYEISSTLPFSHPIFRIHLPPAPLLYTLLFSSTPHIFSRLCHVLITFKTALEKSSALSRSGSGAAAGVGVGGGGSGASGAPPKPQPYPSSFYDAFNGFIMDICNLLWRSRAFVLPVAGDSGNKAALGCTIPGPVVSALEAAVSARGVGDLKGSFFLSRGPMWSYIAAQILGKMEEQRGVDRERKCKAPVSVQTLKQLAEQGGVKVAFMEYRLVVLRGIKKRGYEGVEEFMRNTMTSLIPKGRKAGAVGQRR